MLVEMTSLILSDVITMRFLNFFILLNLSLVVLTSSQDVAANEGKIENLKLDTYDAEEVISRTPSELVELRGFGSETHFAKTKDGYFINVVRIVNNKLPSGPFKRPVIFNHGLLESGTIWLINARDVRPLDIDACDPIPTDPMAFNGTFYLNAPMMLAMRGFDVWIMSMRGTEFSMRHKTLSPSDSEFWNFSIDEQTLKDVPSVVDYVRVKTGHNKVGYVGHSQGTFSAFGLLAAYPKYAEVMEPVVAVAPVAYIYHTSSVVVPVFYAVDDLSGGKVLRFPSRAHVYRGAGRLCDKRLLVAKPVCRLVETLIGGHGNRRLKGHYTHVPFTTSLKVLRHYKQLLEGKKFSRYDEGPAINLKKYGTPVAPLYQPGRIRSKSLVLISAQTDILSVPVDVARFKRELRVPLLRDIFIDKHFNHFDLLLDGEARGLVNKPMLEIFESFEKNTGCSLKSRFNTSTKILHNSQEQAITYSSTLK